MRTSTPLILLLSALAAADFADKDVSTTPEPRPASVPTSGFPLVTTSARLDVLELRQDAVMKSVIEALVANPNAPAVDPVTSTDFEASAVSRPLQKAASATSSSETSTPPTTTHPPSTSATPASFAPGVYSEFTTVQWVETKYGSTYTTWVPKTIILHFRTMSPAPPPGKGEIGMGTLTGKPEQQTVFMGAAPTHGPDWVRGVVAAVGVGVAGLVV